MKNLFSSIVVASVLLMASAQAAEEYGPVVFFDTVSVGSLTNVQGVAIRYTTNGVYTNGAALTTNYYRIDATNRAGRFPLGTNVVAIFRGGVTNGTNAVSISWRPKGGAAGYVVNRSFDFGATWTNWIALSPAVTNWTDYGTGTWSSTTWFTNAYGPAPVTPSVPWPQSVGSTQMFVGAGSTGLLTSTSSDSNKFLQGNGLWGVPPGGGDALMADVIAGDQEGSNNVADATNALVQSGITNRTHSLYLQLDQGSLEDAQEITGRRVLFWEGLSVNESGYSLLGQGTNMGVFGDSAYLYLRAAANRSIMLQSRTYVMSENMYFDEGAIVSQGGIQIRPTGILNFVVRDENDNETTYEFGTNHVSAGGVQVQDVAMGTRSNDAVNLGQAEALVASGVTDAEAYVIAQGYLKTNPAPGWVIGSGGSIAGGLTSQGFSVIGSGTVSVNGTDVMTNRSVTINGIPLGNGTNITISGGSGGSGVINVLSNGTLIASGTNLNLIAGEGVTVSVVARGTTQDVTIASPPNPWCVVAFASTHSAAAASTKIDASGFVTNAAPSDFIISNTTLYNLRAGAFDVGGSSATLQVVPATKSYSSRVYTNAALSFIGSIYYNGADGTALSPLPTRRLILPAMTPIDLYQNSNVAVTNNSPSSVTWLQVERVGP